MNKNRGLKAIVIGGGIHGISSAIALGREGLEVTLLEKRNGLMEATSRATQNRAHLGYHYPRSPETAIECIKGLEFFNKKYSGAVFDTGEDYYLIEKDKSKTSFEEFKDFCDNVGLPYELLEPPRHLYNSRRISGSFKVQEPVYNPDLLRRTLEDEAHEFGVNIRTSSEAIDSEDIGGGYKVISNENGNKKEYKGRIIVNATYSYANNILKLFGLEEDMTKYKLQNTEIVVARSRAEIPALTIMDGPFVTLLPFTNGDDMRLFLVYDVVNSVLNEEENYFFDDSKRYNSNWTKILEHGQEYFPFFKHLEFIAPIYGSRPVPVDSMGDSRQTRIRKHEKKPGIYSILEGKLISAPMVAGELVAKIRSDGLIK